MNSPDRRENDAPDAFDRRIAAAARELRGRAPAGTLAAIQAQARARRHDLDDAIDAAARSLAPRAPAEVLARIRAQVHPGAGAAAPEITLARPRLQLAGARRRLRILRYAAALAAGLLVATSLFLLERDRAATGGTSPALLTSAALEQARLTEAELERETARLEASVAVAPHVAGDETAAALLGEVTSLDAAIRECKDELARNERHTHLREQVAELAGQRVALLRQIEAIGYAAAGGEDRGPRG